MNHVPVVAVIKAKPGQEKVLEGVLKSLLQPSHAEKGCLQYALHRSSQDPKTFVFIEKWESAEALQAHLSTAHIRAAFARQAELIADIHVISLAPILGGDVAKGRF